MACDCPRKRFPTSANSGAGIPGNATIHDPCATHSWTRTGGRQIPRATGFTQDASRSPPRSKTTQEIPRKFLGTGSSPLLSCRNHYPLPALESISHPDSLLTPNTRSEPTSLPPRDLLILPPRPRVLLRGVPRPAGKIEALVGIAHQWTRGVISGGWGLRGGAWPRRRRLRNAVGGAP